MLHSIRSYSNEEKERAQFVLTRLGFSFLFLTSQVGAQNALPVARLWDIQKVK